ncbi:MAG: NADH-quinone oxidoreductase subunit NuoG, partial [Dehalococcoidia bacterium]
MATIHIDGKSYEADPGKNLLQVSLSLGFDLPYFCWHPALGSVGACRQCAVRQYRNEEDQQGHIVMACMLPAAEGARISIEDEEAREFRKSVIEWLMTNHPHDCAVCDEGGECHLQDMTVMTGHCSRRFRFRKRTFTNQYLGPFINHEMNRCIQCYRCVRYYKDYAGGRDLDAFASHNHVYFGRSGEGVLENEFSGNLVEVCPTGVFTDKTLKSHYTRKWDLQSAPSVCAHCSLGCNTLAAARYGGVRRILNRYHHEINGYFLCDRGRYAYEFANHSTRIRQPLVNKRTDDNGAPARLETRSANEALRTARDRLRGARRLIGIGSPRASLESNHALRSLVGKDAFFNGLPAAESRIVSVALDLLRNGPAPTPSLREIEEADAVLVLGEDLTQTAPRMALAVRQSIMRAPEEKAVSMGVPTWNDRGVRDVIQADRGPLFIAAIDETRLDDAATATLHRAPDDIARFGFAVAHAIHPDAPAVEDLSEVDAALARQAADALCTARRPVVITGASLGSEALLHAAANVAWALHRKEKPAALSLVFPEANTLGTALLGGRPLQEAFEAAAGGEADAAIILENDLFRRAGVPDVERFLAQLKTVIAIDSLRNGTTDRAHVVLPAGTFAESDGTFVNNEGRAQRFFQVLAPEGDIAESWRWLGRLPLGDASSDEPQWTRLATVLTAMAAELPELAGVPEAAPSADFRSNGSRFPRSSRRFSGRTAMLAHQDVSEPKPPEDPDSPLSFTMEGSTAIPPAALVSHYWAPGWNSVQALNKFQEEVGGPNRGGNPGVRLFEAKGTPRVFFTGIP